MSGPGDLWLKDYGGNDLCNKVCFESGVKERRGDRWLHDQGRVNVRQRFKDVDEARGMIQECDAGNWYQR